MAYVYGHAGFSAHIMDHQVLQMIFTELNINFSNASYQVGYTETVYETSEYFTKDSFRHFLLDTKDGK